MTLETGFEHTTISICLPKSDLSTHCSPSHFVSDEIGSVYEISSKFSLVAIVSRAQKGMAHWPRANVRAFWISAVLRK